MCCSSVPHLQPTAYVRNTTNPSWNACAIFTKKRPDDPMYTFRAHACCCCSSIGAASVFSESSLRFYKYTPGGAFVSCVCAGISMWTSLQATGCAFAYIRLCRAKLPWHLSLSMPVARFLVYVRLCVCLRVLFPIDLCRVICCEISTEFDLQIIWYVL